jgi:hypothetical protein
MLTSKRRLLTSQNTFSNAAFSDSEELRETLNEYLIEKRLEGKGRSEEPKILKSEREDRRLKTPFSSSPEALIPFSSERMLPTALGECLSVLVCHQTMHLHSNRIAANILCLCVRGLRQAPGSP